jgi:hypothetical protein
VGGFRYGFGRVQNVLLYGIKIMCHVSNSI